MKSVRECVKFAAHSRTTFWIFPIEVVLDKSLALAIKPIISLSVLRCSLDALSIFETRVQSLRNYSEFPVSYHIILYCEHFISF